MFVFYIDEWFVLCCLVQVAVLRISLLSSHLFVPIKMVVVLSLGIGCVDAALVVCDINSWIGHSGFGDGICRRGMIHLACMLLEYVLVCKKLRLKVCSRAGIRLIVSIFVSSLLFAGSIVLLDGLFSRHAFCDAFVELSLLNVAVWLWGRCSEHVDGAEQLYRVAVKCKGKEVCVWAYYDSGNGLVDPYFGNPVVLASELLLLKLDLYAVPKLKIPFYSLGENNGLVDGYVIDELNVTYKTEKKRFANVVLADASYMFEHARPGYDLILHRSMK